MHIVIVFVLEKIRPKVDPSTAAHPDGMAIFSALRLVCGETPVTAHRWVGIVANPLRRDKVTFSETSPRCIGCRGLRMGCRRAMMTIHAEAANRGHW
jgi:hypothetical protein